jgi:lipopolysaccharide transport system ATP-binding protein
MSSEITLSDIAVRIEGLGKQYQLGHVEGPTLLRELLTDWARETALGLTDPSGNAQMRSTRETIWALRDVTFNVARGETLGIIGSNGAGKSTLLKILSRITVPTEGNAWIRGRVGSLLEVGTGFHAELTGRENIYLSGAVLGMKRREIARNFDEIVAFSGVERFIDTPVKRYSSGMYLRLAFAVAAHFEPEILIVDEVLAVGDASFQRKCIGKMADVARAGRTVVFVSHNLAAVQSLCSTAILLRGGALVAQGPVNDVITEYLRNVEQVATRSLRERTDRRGRGEFRLAGVEVSSDQHAPLGVLVTGWSARFAFDVDGFRPGLSVWFTIYDQQRQPICSFHSLFHGPEDTQDGAFGSHLVCEVPDLPLVPGFYRINAAVYTDHELQDHVEGAAVFEVVAGALRGRPVAERSGHGSVRLHHRWILPSGAPIG